VVRDILIDALEARSEPGNFLLCKSGGPDSVTGSNAIRRPIA
jgi:hypothetical protein